MFGQIDNLPICLHMFIIFRFQETSAAAVGPGNNPIHSTVDTSLFNMETIRSLLGGRQLKDFIRITEEEFPVILEKLQVKLIRNPFNLCP